MKLIKIKNHHGFSLIEIIIAMALLGSMIAGFMQMMRYTQVSNTKQVVANDLNQLILTITGILSTQDSCKLMLSGKTYPSTFPSNIYDGLQIGALKINKGDVFGSIKIQSIEWLAPENFLSSGTLSVNGTVVNVTSYLATLKIEAVSANPTMSLQTYQRKISVIVSIDSARKILNCASILIDTNALCTQMNGVMDTGSCRLSVKTSNTGSPPEPGNSCSPEGSMLFIENQGMLVCSAGTFKLLKQQSKCEMKGGRDYYINSTNLKICRFEASACPAGTEALPFTATVSNTCYGGSTTGCNPGKSCTTGSHPFGFSLLSPESCFAERYIACGGLTNGGVQCRATITEVGCKIP